MTDHDGTPADTAKGATAGRLDNIPPQVEALIKAYGRLKSELDLSAEKSQEKGERQGMIATLDAFRNFLLFDNENMRSNRYRRILRHRARLLDLDRGITHETLRPNGTKAGALHDAETELIKVVGLILSDTHKAICGSRSRADSEAVRGLKSIGITQIGENGPKRTGKITDTKLETWRDWIRRQDKKAPFNSLSLHENLTEAMNSHRVAGTLNRFPMLLIQFLDESLHAR